jgi:hypothetical protein
MDDSGQRTSFGDGKAMREVVEGKGRYELISPFALRRLAIWLEQGAKKYASRNWEKGGIPFSRYTDSALRHLQKHLMGMEDEDHLAGVMFNVMAMMHFQELNKLQDDDLPHYLKEGDDNEQT